MIRHSRLTALGIIICLLAALFAVEAKIAWFSPAGSAGAQFSASKACPAEQPKMLPARLAWPESPSHEFSAVLALLVAFLLALLSPAGTMGLFPDRAKPAGLSGFDAALFFRPPPIL